VSGAFISQVLRLEITRRARHRCEYCLLHSDFALLAHEADHIIATQHGGVTATDNLALACFDCNRLKGPNVASVDPDTRRVLPLFHPRQERWDEHFKLDGARILPLTPTGRATAALLRFNTPDRLRLREASRQAGRYPG
jgi:hypothetical protein